MLIMFFFQTSITPLTDSLTQLTAKSYGKSFANLRSYGSFGFAITALLVNPFIQKIGYSYTLTIYAFVLFLVLLVATQLSERVGESSKVSFKGIFKFLKNKEFIFVLGTIFLLAIAHRTNDNFLSLYLREIGMEKYLGFAYMISALSEIPVFLLLSKFGHRIKTLHLLAIAAFFYFIRFTIVAQSTHPSFVILAQLMHSVTFGIFYITAIRYISSKLPDEYRSSGQAIFTITFSGVASITSGFLGGWIYEFGSGRLLYSTISICSLLACMMFLILQNRETKLLRK
jgi:PPP family 3-phenylpropionic acid transporter